MRIVPIEIEIDYWPPKRHTLLISIVHLDFPDFDTSLLSIGWYQGIFTWDVLFLEWAQRKYELWRDK